MTPKQKRDVEKIFVFGVGGTTITIMDDVEARLAFFLRLFIYLDSNFQPHTRQ